MSNPLVSIIIPTFNRAHLIGETLNSVLGQTYQNWECIVVDDGSSDKTAALMAEYLAKDIRFQFHHRPKNRLKGGNAARNYGFEISKGEFINWLDSDDLLTPEKLDFQVDFFLGNRIEVHICQGQFFEENEKGNKVLHELWPEKFPDPNNNIIDSLLLESLRWPSGAPLWSRKAASVNLWDEKLLGAQEWTFHIMQAFSLTEEDILFDEKVLIHIRKTATSITQNPQKIQRFEAYLNARIGVLQFLSDSDISGTDQYFKSIYIFSLRYVKYLVSVNAFKSVDSLGKLIGRSSYKKYLEFKFGLFIYQNFKKDYFLKRLF